MVQVERSASLATTSSRRQATEEMSPLAYTWVDRRLDRFTAWSNACGAEVNALRWANRSRGSAPSNRASGVGRGRIAPPLGDDKLGTTLALHAQRAYNATALQVWPFLEPIHGLPTQPQCSSDDLEISLNQVVGLVAGNGSAGSSPVFGTL